MLVPMREAMFLANDPLDHDVAYGDIADGYMVENAQEGLIVVCGTLIQALQVMEDRTGKSIGQFTITNNPY